MVADKLTERREKAFTFDHVFDTRAAQSEIFQACVEPLYKQFSKGVYFEIMKHQRKAKIIAAAKYIL